VCVDGLRCFECGVAFFFLVCKSCSKRVSLSPYLTKFEYSSIWVSECVVSVRVCVSVCVCDSLVCLHALFD
jgi:hypothetical protein